MVTTTGYPASALSESGALPTGVSFADNGDGTATLAGTPAGGRGGTYAFTVNASNGVGSGATQDFTLTVDQAPAVTSASGATFTVGTAGRFTVTTTGYPASALSESGALPSGLSFTDNGDGTATLAGTPAGGRGGTYALTITASNGVGSGRDSGLHPHRRQGPDHHERLGHDVYRGYTGPLHGHDDRLSRIGAL